jgi:hypothetical protein
MTVESADIQQTTTRKAAMKPIHPIGRAASILTGLAAALLAFSAAPTALAAPAGIGPVGGSPALPGPNLGGYPPAPVQIHTIITGGMPGWQITLIAAAAAILTAAAAVILDRARTGRRHPTAPSA